jgi:hypothetical protein
MYEWTLTDFIIEKKKHRQYLKEATIGNYMLQLVSALQSLHSKKYIHAPGEINSNRVYLNRKQDEIYLDIGRRASSISTKWLLENSHELLANRRYKIFSFYVLSLNVVLTIQ